MNRVLFAILGLFGSVAFAAENTVYLADERLKISFPTTWVVDTHWPNHFNAFLVLVVDPEQLIDGTILHQGKMVPAEGTVAVSIMTLPGPNEIPWKDADAKGQVVVRGEWKIRGPAAEKHDENWPENQVLSALKYHHGLKAWLGVSVKWNHSDSKDELKDQESEMNALLESVLERIDRDNEFGTEKADHAN